MKKITLLAMLFSAIAFTSCTKDSAVDPNGTSTGNYYPMAVGNLWNMKTDANPSMATSITGTDVFGEVTYYKLSDALPGSNIGSIMGADTQTWIVKKGATYFTKIGDVTIPQDGGSIKISAFEVPVLRDDLAAAKTWTGTMPVTMTVTAGTITQPVQIAASYTGTILEKNVAATVNGVSYPDVIKVSMKEVFVGPDPTTGQNKTIEIDQEVWYAKAVGPVKMVQTSDGQTTEVDLVSSVLK